ncbi:MAG: universal stress protein [Bacteroidota bacterium]|nr:universal stress protein [Bacteroidota bacterium]
MKTILVPTDFSLNAEKAIEYAVHLAVYFSSEIILLHAWELPHQKSAMFKYMQDAIKEKAEKNTSELKEKIQDRFPELKIRTVVLMDEADDAIRSLAKTTAADLIIMGTKGASGMQKYFLGSVAADVIEDAPCAVFAVPEKTEYRNIDTICFTTNFENYDIKSIANLIPLAEKFNAKIIVTHIEKGNENEESRFNEFAEKIKSSIKYKNLETSYLKGNDIVERINEFVSEKGIDVLAVARKKRNFLEGLFHKSITREITYTSTIPLMVFQGLED